MASRIGAFLLIATWGCHADPMESAVGLDRMTPDAPSAALGGALAGDAYANVGVRVVRLPGNDFWQFAQFGCTITLIAPTVALTAGHCIANPTAANQELAVMFRSDVPLVGIPTSEVIRAAGHVHPGYRPGGVLEREYDLGVLILEEAVTDLRPARLPEPGALARAALNEANDDLVMVGFGVSNFPPPPPGNAGKRQFTIMDIQELAGSRLIVRSSDPDVSACLGDSGSPYAHAGDRPRGNGVGQKYIREVLAVFYGTTGCSGDNYGWRIDEPETLDWISQFLEPDEG